MDRATTMKEDTLVTTVIAYLTAEVISTLGIRARLKAGAERTL